MSAKHGSRSHLPKSKLFREAVGFQSRFSPRPTRPLLPESSSGFAASSPSPWWLPTRACDLQPTDGRSGAPLSPLHREPQRHAVASPPFLSRSPDGRILVRRTGHRRPARPHSLPPLSWYRKKKKSGAVGSKREKAEGICEEDAQRRISRRSPCYSHPSPQLWPQRRI